MDQQPWVLGLPNGALKGEQITPRLDLPELQSTLYGRTVRSRSSRFESSGSPSVYPNLSWDRGYAPNSTHSPQPRAVEPRCLITLLVQGPAPELDGSRRRTRTRNRTRTRTRTRTRERVCYCPRNTLQLFGISTALV